MDGLFHHQWRVVMARLLAIPTRHRLPGELPGGVPVSRCVSTLRLGVARGKMLVASAIAAVYALFLELQTLVFMGREAPNLAQLRRLEPLTPTADSDFPYAVPSALVKAANLDHLVFLEEWHFCDVVEALVPLINGLLDTNKPLRKLTLQGVDGTVRECCPSVGEKVGEFEAAGVECELIRPNDTDVLQQHWIQHPREMPIGVQW